MGTSPVTANNEIFPDVMSRNDEVSSWLKDASGTDKSPPKLTPDKSVLSWLVEVQA